MMTPETVNAMLSTIKITGVRLLVRILFRTKPGSWKIIQISAEIEEGDLIILEKTISGIPMKIFPGLKRE